MASIQDRTPFVVTVEGQDKLTRSFSVGRPKDAQAYLAEMKRRYPQSKVSLARGQGQFQVRLRRKGQREQSKTFESRKQAIEFARKMEQRLQTSLPKQGAWRSRIANSRARRLQPEELVRLLNAARCEDQLRSIRLRVVELTERAQAVASHQSTSSSSATPKSAYRKTRAEARASYKHVPLLESCVRFLLDTAARRDEALDLLWKHVDFDAQLACVPSFMNYRERTFFVPSDVLTLLGQLPRTSDKVFALSAQELTRAWRRICNNADIAELRLSDLRHEAISRAAEARVA